MERVLITGVDTAVGGNLALKLAERFDVLGLYDRCAVESPYVRTALACDDRAALEELVRDWMPQWVIHCGAFSGASWDCAPSAADLDDAPRMAQWLSMLAAALSARLTVISSDVVCRGPRMFHEENCELNSDSPWAERVLAVERILDGTLALVVRTHAYGFSPTKTNHGFAEGAHTSLAAGSAVAADGLRHATPILATDLADLLVRAFELRLHGRYHLAGAERTSPFRFVRELAAACGMSVPSQWGSESPQGDIAPLAETSLNSKRARRALQLPMPLLRDGLNRFAEQAAGGWRDQWRMVDRAVVQQLVA